MLRINFRAAIERQNLVSGVKTMLKMTNFVVAVFVLLLVQVISSIPSPKESTASICHQPEDPGVCRALMPRWRYDAVKKECYEFNYGGCRGNENNFLTKKACMDKCSGV